MTRAAQHLDYTPGLADGFCGDCRDIGRLVGPYCCTHDVRLRQDEDGRARRCAECLRCNRPDEGND